MSLPRVLVLVLAGGAGGRLELLAADLTALGGSSHLPPEPDWAWINGWLHRSYLKHWARQPENGT